MNLQPIYTPENARPVHNLRFDWTGWLRSQPANRHAVTEAIAACRDAWRNDGIDLETSTCDKDAIKLLARTQPGVSPVVFAQRIKGRLQHALRQTDIGFGFRRKTAVRTVGDNTRRTVETYVARQAAKSDYIDPLYKAFLGRFSVADPAIHLSTASTTAHGRYWYNLHLVIVVADRRCPVTWNENFRKLRGGCTAIAKKKEYALSNLAIMPDHIHLALRGAVEQSPEEIALAFLNNLSYLMGYNRCWNWEYYVGTFSEYDIRAIHG